MGSDHPSLLQKSCHAGTLFTILDYLDGKGQVKASCLCRHAQGCELNAPVPGGVIQLCVLDGFLQINIL